MNAFKNSGITLSTGSAKEKRQESGRESCASFYRARVAAGRYGGAWRAEADAGKGLHFIKSRAEIKLRQDEDYKKRGMS